MKLDLGCGNNKKRDFFGIDIFNHKHVDMVMDINKGIPLKSNSVEYLYTSNFLEHSLRLNFIMEEIARICHNKSIVEIIVPHFKSIPCEEHLREFRSSSLVNYEINNSNYGYTKFLVCKSRKLIFKNRLLNLLFKNHLYFFERFYPFRVNCQFKMIFEVKK